MVYILRGYMCVCVCVFTVSFHVLEFSKALGPPRIPISYRSQ